MRNNPCLAAAPRLVQIIYFLFAIEVEPDQHGRFITVLFSESAIGQEHSAASFRDSCDPTVLTTPIYAKAQLVLVVRRSFADVTDRYFGYRTRKVVFHSGSQLQPLMTLAVKEK